MTFKPIIKKMKTIKLKKENEKLIINNTQIETEIRTTDLIKVALNSPVQGGYSISDISFRIKLLDMTNLAEKEEATEIKLEDTDYQEFTKIVKETKWSVVSKIILDFVNDFDKN